MIGLPVNDHTCLGQITEVIADLVRQRDPVLEELASRYPSKRALVGWIRSLPQRDDDGEPGDGPKVDVCRPPQRLRIPAPDPNCVERAALYVAVAELLEPRTTRQLATIDTPAGRHTLPVERGEPVVLDPSVSRNAARGALYRNAPAPVRMTPAEAVDWLCQLAEEPAAAHRGGLERVAAARAALRGCLDGAPIPDRLREDVAFVLASAEREARAFGPNGVVVAMTTIEALGELDADLPRNGRRRGVHIGGYRVRPNWGALGALERVGARMGARAGGAAVRAYLAARGVPLVIVDELEQELRREGMTLGALARPAPMPGTLAAVAADAVRRAA